jgi:IstB-like ATP binding protein
VLFATATEWVSRLAEAHHAGRLQHEMRWLGRYPLLVEDEAGYVPFEPEAANLFFQLVAARYERASLIVTSTKPFGRWGEVFGDEVVAAAMIDRLVHYAEVIALKGDSYQLRDRDLGRSTRPPPKTHDHEGVNFGRRYGVSFQPSLTTTLCGVGPSSAARCCMSLRAAGRRVRRGGVRTSGLGTQPGRPGAQERL